MSITQDFRQLGFAGQSLSTHLAVQNTDYRNCVGVVDPDLFERIGRRVYGELGYAAILVVALVETVVRAALFYLWIPLLTVLACCTDANINIAADFWLEYFGAGAIISLGNAVACSSALVRNIFERTVHYGCLFPLLSFCYASAVDRRGAQPIYIEPAPVDLAVVGQPAAVLIQGQQPVPPPYRAA